MSSAGKLVKISVYHLESLYTKVIYNGFLKQYNFLANSFSAKAYFLVLSLACNIVN